MIQGIEYRIKTLLYYLKFNKYLPVIKRHDDIYLVSYPKSGNTWLSFILANVMNDYLNLKLKVNFNSIRYFVPDIHVDRNINPDLELYPFRRIIKSHSKYNPFYKNVILLVRNPYDVMVSFYHYSKKLGHFDGDIDKFIKDKSTGIVSWREHTLSWLEKPSIRVGLKIIKYEDLKKTPESVTKQIFSQMGYEVSDEIIKAAVSKSDFENMKKIEVDTFSFATTKHKDFKFVRKGKIGGGMSELSDRAIDFIFENTKEFLQQLGYEELEPDVIKAKKREK